MTSEVAERAAAERTTSRDVSAKRRYEGLAWAFLGVLLFSFSVPLTKVAVRGFDPTVTAMGRAAIAGALALVPLALRRLPRPAASDLRPLFITMLGAVFGWPILIALAFRETQLAPLFSILGRQYCRAAGSLPVIFPAGDEKCQCSDDAER